MAENEGLPTCSEGVDRSGPACHDITRSQKEESNSCAMITETTPRRVRCSFKPAINQDDGAKFMDSAKARGATHIFARNHLLLSDRPVVVGNTETLKHHDGVYT